MMIRTSFYSRILLFPVSLILFSIASCKHEPEEVVINDPIDPGDTTTYEITCDPDTVYFTNTILPMLVSTCGMSGCHDASTAEEGVVLTSYESILSTGEIIPGNPGRSELYEAITESDLEDRMPPSPRDPLSADQILLIRKWIEQGAKNNYCLSDCDTLNYAYSTAIEQIIETNCVGCHNASLSSGNVRLDSFEAVRSVAANGSLLGVVSHQPGYAAMPQGGNKLSDCNITQIKKWIDEGAPEN